MERFALLSFENSEWAWDAEEEKAAAELVIELHHAQIQPCLAFFEYGQAIITEHLDLGSFSRKCRGSQDDGPRTNLSLHVVFSSIRRRSPRGPSSPVLAEDPRSGSPGAP